MLPVGEIATLQEVSFGRQLRGNCWYVIMHIRDGGTLSFTTDKGHEICRQIMEQIGEIDKLRKGDGQRLPQVHRPR